MAALRNTLVAEVNNAMQTNGYISAENLHEVLKLLRRCFTCHENPWRGTQSDKVFQRRFEENLDKDLAYRREPSLGAYLGKRPPARDLADKWTFKSGGYHQQTRKTGTL